MYTPCGAPLVWKVVQVTVPSGVNGLGLNVSGVRVVPHGCAGSPQFGKANVATTPVNDEFFVTAIVIEPFAVLVRVDRRGARYRVGEVRDALDGAGIDSGEDLGPGVVADR